MIRVCLSNGTDISVGGTELIALPLPKGSSLWIDIHKETPGAEEIIFDQFGCHPLCIQDARRERHPQKPSTLKISHLCCCGRSIQYLRGCLLRLSR
jgi:magnesium transporter